MTRLAIRRLGPRAIALEARPAERRETYHERKLAGICTSCGDRDALEDNQLCGRCVKVQREHKRRSAAQVRLLFGELGLCIDCRAEPVAPPRPRRCATCVENRRLRRLGALHPQTV